MTQSKKRVLLVTYSYPPMQSAGALRTASFAKHLPQFGYDVSVITVRINRFSWRGFIDESFCPPKKRVIRVKGLHIGETLKTLSQGRLSGYGQSRAAFQSKNSFKPKKILSFIYDNILTFPDPAWSWYVFGLKDATRAAMQIQPDILLSSALPVSAHLIARNLKIKFKIPWIADYRDLWSHGHISNRKPFFRSIEYAMEKRFLEKSDALTTVSGPLAIKLREVFDKPVHVITNGYEPDEFEAEANSLSSKWAKRGINVVYTGMIYPNRQDPGPLFKAIQLLIENKRIKEGEFTCHLFGPNVGFAETLFPSELLKGYVVIGGNLNRSQALRCQKEADLLVVFDWMDPSEKGVYTTKLFEYIGAGKPILSIGPKGTVIDKTLTTEGIGIAEDDPKQLAIILERFIKTGALANIAPHHKERTVSIERFTREYQAGKLAEVLDQIIEKSAAGTST